jgi:uncharacterized iron-regulated membrane protein
VAADADGSLSPEAGLSGPMWLYPPAEPGHAWQVTENKRDWPTRHDAIAVDPSTGVVTNRVSFADWPFLAKLTDWAIDAHMGVLFGLANQIVLALTAIGLITVIARGYHMWWQRRPTRDSAWAVGRPPLRGTLRHVSPAVAVAAGLAAIAIGWFLPLLGASLLAFLLIDVYVGAVKRARAPRDGSP